MKGARNGSRRGSDESKGKNIYQYLRLSGGETGKQKGNERKEGRDEGKGRGAEGGREEAGRQDTQSKEKVGAVQVGKVGSRDQLRERGKKGRNEQRRERERERERERDKGARAKGKVKEGHLNERERRHFAGQRRRERHAA